LRHAGQRVECASDPRSRGAACRAPGPRRRPGRGPARLGGPRGADLVQADESLGLRTSAAVAPRPPRARPSPPSSRSTPARRAKG